MTSNLRLDPTKPRISPLPDFASFSSTAFRIPIGSDLDEQDARLAQAIYGLASRHAQVLFEIDSDGGNPGEIGLINELILDLMETKVEGRFIDVRGLVLDKCYSAAMTIFMTFPTAARYCKRSSRFLIHSAHFGFNAPRLSPEGEKLLAEVNWLRVINPIAENTRIERTSLQSAVDSGQDVYLTSTQALELGIVSAIV